jgi:IS30 family transposase
MKYKNLINPEIRAKLDEIYKRSNKRHNEMSENQKLHLKRAEIITKNIEQARAEKYARLDTMTNQEVIDEMTKNSKNLQEINEKANRKTYTFDELKNF